MGKKNVARTYVVYYLCAVVLFVSLHLLTVQAQKGTGSGMDARCAEILSDKNRNPRERELQECLDHVHASIEKSEEKLEKQQKERTNTEQGIAIINQEINKALLRIRSSDVIIQDLGEEIGGKESMIDELADELQEREAFLASLLQRINELEQRGFVTLLFSNTTLSSYFFKENEYRSLHKVTEDSVRDINSLKSRLTASIGELEEKKVEQGRIRQHQQVSMGRVKDKRGEKEKILKSQLADEESTKESLQADEERAAKIRNRLFNLRGGGAIPFDEALTYAKEVHRATGVRPAFLLGLIKHESDLGRNVGTGTYRVDMHPTRDQPVFLHIVRLLGLEDPDKLRVSASPGFGWGGAMGPAQFIPSTWVCYGGLVNTKTETCSITNESRVVVSTARLQVGSTGADVKRLQQFLNKNGFVIANDGPGSPGKETSTYTNAVAKTVSRFQERYASRILKPYGLKQGNGQVGPSTRGAVNQLEFYGGNWRYKKEADIIRRYTKNNRPSNPWNPRDAFFASGIYLERLGAAGNECRAAGKYYAGSNWRSQVARMYCNGVLAKARDFERDIAFLQR